MESDVTLGASSAPDPVSAPVAKAVEKQDFSAFQQAKRAERSNPSLASPAASPAATADQPPASTDASSSAASEPARVKKNADSRKAELDAEIQTRLQKRKELDAEIARESARLASLRTPASDGKAASSPAAGIDPSDPEPNPADAARYPDGQFDRQYLKDQARWETRQELKEREQAQMQRAQRESLTQAQEARVQGFAERLKAATASDPEFISRISPDVLALKPFSALLPGERPSALNAIAEELLSSPIAPTLMRHFTDHPEDLARLGALGPRDLLREMGKLESRYASDDAAVTPPKTATDAPEPPATLGSRASAPADPIKAAVRTQDFTAFQRAKRQLTAGRR